MSTPIFVSYSSKDQNIALSVCRSLEGHGFRCWISCRDILPGENFQVAIVRAIRAAKVMVLVFSANSNNSEEIKKELVLAGQCRLIVVPVRVEDVTPDEAFAYEFATRQWVDLFHDWENSVKHLAEQLMLVAGIAPHASAAAAPARPEAVAGGATRFARTRFPLPRALIGVALFGGAALAGFWLWVAQPRPAPSSIAAPAAKSTTPQSALAGAGVQPAPVPAPPPAVKTAAAKPPAASSPSALAPPVREPSASEALATGTRARQRQDYGEAMRWYRRAADQGDALAETEVGLLYMEGRGVERNYAEAMRWYRQAADRGNALALVNIGFLYEKGWGVAQDYAEAMRWYRQAADQENAFAQNSVGYLYMHGWGVMRDYAEAMRWYRKAADQGLALARTNIGLLYMNGWGVTRDDAAAMRWFREAVGHGDTRAEYNIGLLYENGLGVPRDPAQAREWMQQAAAAGNEPAKQWLAHH